jgi:hypothetical protein
MLSSWLKEAEDRFAPYELTRALSGTEFSSLVAARGLSDTDFAMFRRLMCDTVIREKEREAAVYLVTTGTPENVALQSVRNMHAYTFSTPDPAGEESPPENLG